MTEAELDAAIVQLCGDLGLVTLHVREPRREGGDWAGFPDRIIYGSHPPYVLYRELKARTGLSSQQKRWRWILGQAHQDHGVWTPADWQSGQIAEELAALAGQDASVVVSGEEDPEAAFYRALYGKRR